nr:MAG TPA: Endomembrane protein 70 [Caudoviricetes sp.]
MFRLECEYCWWWRGFLVGSIVASVLFILFIKVLELL